MLHVDIPTLPEIRALIAVRADACVSIYVPTTPEPQHLAASRIAFGNQTKTALEQLETTGFDKRRRAELAAELAALGQRRGDPRRAKGGRSIESMLSLT